MRRRDFLDLLATAPLLPASAQISWSPIVNGLRLGLRVDSHQRPRNLLAFFENLGQEPLDLFVARGEVHRIEFTAITFDHRTLKLNDAALYIPCAGLCAMPVTETLAAGATRQFTLPADKQLYVPRQGKYATLDILLEKCSVQASFEMTAEQLKEAPLLENPWLGLLTTPEVHA